MPTYFMIMDYTMDSISIWDMKNSLELSIEHRSSFAFFFLICTHLKNTEKKTYQKEIYSLKFKVTPTKGLIGETNSLRL